MIHYISTRGSGAPQSYEDVLLAGLAPDGGLYMPERWPQIDLADLKGKSYTEIAEEVIFPFVEGSLDRPTLRRLLDESYGPAVFEDGEVAPLHLLRDNIYVMELFHGPTIAFKDVALQLLGRQLDHVLKKRDEKVTIVSATSGDTGSAAIEGCYRSDRVNIFILYPHGLVSDVQRRQMTTVHADNVQCMALKGDFDACQKAVKAMSENAAFRDRIKMTTANSMNWSRIVAQIVYYVKAAAELGPGTTFVVPTGNFGNVFAGYCAKKMGAPINLVVATNQNDILARFFESGEMRREGEQAVSTLSPSMDITISSNFERYLFELLDRDAAQVSALMRQFRETNSFAVSPELLARARRDFTAFRADDEETVAVMRRVYAETGYRADPHTAVGMKAAFDVAGGTKGPIVVLGTASPAKFPEAVQQATGTWSELPPRLAGLMERDEKFTVLPNDLAAVEAYIIDHT